MKQDLDLARPEAPLTRAPDRSSSGPRRVWIGVLVALALVALWKVRSNRGAAPAAGTTTVKVATPPIPVRLASVTHGTVVSTVEVSGEIAALTDVTLASKTTARVLAVNAREGDPVRAGQLLVAMDTSDLDSQVRSAQAALASAQAHASQALVTERLQAASSRLGIESARETLKSAQARLLEAEHGARTQERLQAQSAVAIAQANRDDAQTEFNRTQQLFNEGAIAQSAVDTGRTRLRVTQAQLDSAEQQASLVYAGTREEQLAQFQSAVDQARQGLALARDNQRQVAIKQQDYQAAVAMVRQSRAAVSLAQANRSQAFLYSPVNGTVEKRSVETGQLATVGAALLKITVPGTVFFSADLSERDVARVAQGQAVMVRVDALPGDTFRGRVARIYPSADSTSRSFTVRVTLEDGRGRLRPGMFARGAIVLSRRSGVLIVPKSAMIAAGSPVPLAGDAHTGSSVFVVRDDRLVRKPIVLGSPSVDGVEAVQGLSPDERVVVSGSRLEEGQKVDVAH